MTLLIVGTFGLQVQTADASLLENLIQQLNELSIQLENLKASVVSSPATSSSPICNSFVATSTSILLGDSAKLTWQTSNGSKVVINNGVGNVAVSGSKVVSPEVTTVYKLTISNTKNTVNCSVTVEVKNMNTTASTTRYLIQSGDFLRSFRIVLPKGYDKNKSYPLLFMLHGFGGAAYEEMVTTNMVAKSNEENFIVVGPNGYKASWNDGRGSAGGSEASPAAKAGVDDVAYVKQLLKIMQKNLNIDPKRIYASGHSNGAMMTERLGCEMSDILAAIGTGSGPMASDITPQCKKGSPISVISFHGTADTVVPIAGGHFTAAGGGYLTSAEETIKNWRLRDKCSATSTPSIRKFGTTTTATTYSDCAAGTSVKYYVIKDMGHPWASKFGRNPQVISATDEMWTFFKNHPKQ